MISAAIFALGAIIGSFLNVCILRVPARQSVVTPRSRCPVCGVMIRPRDNMPIVSYLFLRGRCRDCQTTISPRYPAVEILGGLAALSAYAVWGLSLQSAVSLAFLDSLIVITFIDIDHQIIPDVISLPGIVVGLLVAFLPGGIGWEPSLLGIVLGGGILWGVAELYYRLTGREGMGGGDIKLLAMIGAFLGWKAVPLTLMLASLVGSLVGLGLILLRGRDTGIPIPFGPFLAAGAACALFFGEALISWYLNFSWYLFP